MSGAGRRWLEVAARCPGVEDADALLADALIELGGRAIVERDGWQLTHLEEPESTDGLVEDFTERLRAATGLPGVEVRLGWQDHEDWSESWKRGLAPRRITERLVVRPSWTTFDAGERDLVIVLDPGMAFGTAEHGTTRGCLRLIDRGLRAGDTVLDVGAGSGILSVAAAMLGAESVHAVEGDPLACEALVENVESNGVADRVRTSVEWADAEKLRSWGPVDGVIANIETGILLPLLDGFRAALGDEGWLVLSGILAEEWETMRTEALARGFRLERLDEDGMWRSAFFRLPGA